MPTPSTIAPTVAVFYDRDCGFCRWSLAALLRWDRQRRLRPVALQTEEARRVLAGMPEDERMGSAHVALPDGRVFSGGQAAVPLLELLPAGAPVAAVAGRVPGLMDRAYGWVAGNRGVLGRRLPRSFVERATKRIDQHA